MVVKQLVKFIGVQLQEYLTNNFLSLFVFFHKDYEMLYRAWIGKTRVVTACLEDLDGCESVDIFINKIWEVYR